MSSFSAKRGANKQINNHNGTCLIVQRCNGITEMAAACVTALLARHDILTTPEKTAATAAVARETFDEAIREKRL